MATDEALVRYNYCFAELLQYSSIPSHIWGKLKMLKLHRREDKFLLILAQQASLTKFWTVQMTKAQGMC